MNTDSQNAYINNIKHILNINNIKIAKINNNKSDVYQSNIFKMKPIFLQFSIMIFKEHKQ